MLLRYLTADVIRLRVLVPDWIAALRVAGDLLVAAGACTSSYVEAIIDGVHQFGPYIVLAPGLALAHARPESGMLKMGLSLVTLDPPIPFGSEENDPVSILLAFGAGQPDEHIELLSELAQFLGNTHSYQRIIAAQTPADVLQAVHDYTQNL